MSEPVARFSPWRHFFTFGFIALVFATLSFWLGSELGHTRAQGLTWFAASGLFVLSAAVLFVAAFRPAIEIHSGYVRVGNETVPWNQIRNLDRTSWISPLVVNMTLVDNRRLRLIYPANLTSCAALLRQLRRNAKDALIDGIPYQQYWGDLYPKFAAPATAGPATTAPPPSPDSSAASPAGPPAENRRKQQPQSFESPKYRLLRQEDEEEVIRLYQRLKSVGHMDPKDRSTGEN